ncbi:leucine-rich repeat-domain-containing protein [Rhodotorula diobovata]|uniref:U2 small nuclear ribonucleoprotein A' n=1 Tax=Rhodotorula diobovata TaxID=5288 RepID=A0A5C5G621_9BASI|nr:leucine-rich repeat-domain-containing protein [Rhodotorula diobovata]
MVRLDADLLARTPAYLSPLKERELDLRGHKIPAIENLAVTRDQLDSLDLTDNSIAQLANFPLLRRLKQLILANNPVRSLSPSVPTALPNLDTLVLSNSAFPKESLPALGHTLAQCRKLTHLVLRGAPVASADHYKDWLVFRLAHLRSLDYDRITLRDRQHARALFLDPATGNPTELHSAFLAAAAQGAQGGAAPSLVPTKGARTFEPGVEATEAAQAGKAGRLLTREEKDRVRKAIEGAESVEEIRRLQRMLAQGFVPTEKDLRDLDKRKRKPAGAGAGAGANGEAMQE